MKDKRTALCVTCVLVLVAGSVSVADVLNMDPGLTSLETVHVGNPGNTADVGNNLGAVDYAFNIGKYEVTAGQYTEFLNAVATTDTYGLYNTMYMTDGTNIQRSGHSGGYTYSVASDWANRPVNAVSWGDAARFANWLHNGQPTGAQNDSTTEDGAYDLSPTQQYYGPDGETPQGGDPEGDALDAALNAVSRQADWQWAITSEDEWYKAAYHKNDGPTGNYFDYPASSDNGPGRDMTETTNPGNNANHYFGSGVEGYLIGSPYYRTEVGEFELSDSPYGTFDQGGNVMEWNEALVDVQMIGPVRVKRGGWYGGVAFDMNAHVYAFGRASSRSHHNTGFRVAHVPEPATMAILALGLGFLVRRRSPA